MRKVTRNAVKSFLSGKSGSFSNTCVAVNGNRVELFLHGNLIAVAELENGGVHSIRATFAGWQTPTTKERLNGLVAHAVAPSAGFYQKNWQLYYRDGNGNDVAVGSTDWVELV